jgi:hypothetical protein
MPKGEFSKKEEPERTIVKFQKNGWLRVVKGIYRIDVVVSPCQIWFRPNLKSGAMLLGDFASNGLIILDPPITLSKGNLIKLCQKGNFHSGKTKKSQCR